MSSDTKIYTLDEFKEHDNVDFSKTHLNVLYKAFFDNECRSIVFNNDYCGPDENYEHLPQRYKELYKKLERNIKSITNSLYIYDLYETDKNKLCFYLKYWFYDQLIVNTFTDPEMDELLKLWNQRKGQECANCQCEFDVKKMEEIKILKNIYDYFLFLDAFKDINKISTEISKRTYCKYVALGSISRSMYEDYCKSKITSFCKEFNKYIKEYVKLDEKSFITCDDDVSSQAFKYAAALRPDQNIKRKEEEEDKDAVLDPEGEEDEEEVHSSPSPSLLLSLPATNHAISASSDVVGQHLQPIQEENAEGVTDLQVPSSSDDGKSTGTIISASSVGTVGFLFLLYKFTPLRSMLDPRIRKTKNNLMNAVQGSNELQSQDYDFYPQAAPFNRYNIGYQS